jgi:hypothetical protein
MGLMQFDIRYPTGQRESIVVEGERALIGSGSHCDVRLPMDQAAYENVLVESVGGTLRAESTSETQQATINGMPLTAAMLNADSVLGLGRIRLFVNFVPDLSDGGALVSSKKKKESSPLVQVGLVAMFVMGGYLLLAEKDSSITPPPAEAPELFPSSSATCPQAEPIQALAFAKERIDLGDAKRERLPFVVQEGVAAVGLYEQAAACFNKGGSEAQAKDATDSAETLKRDLTDDFRARRIRLSHLLTVQDYDLAKKDVAVLRALLEDRKGIYSTWLDTVSRQLAAAAPPQ